MSRLLFLTFFGPFRGGHEAEHHLHESPPSMIVPLVVLALLSIVGGWVGPPLMPGGNPFHHWLAPVFGGGAHGASAAHGAAAGHGAEAAHEVSRTTEILLIVASVAGALLGIFFAFRAYLQQPGLATRLQQQFAGLHKMLLNKYWIDELYDAIVVRPVRRLSEAFWKFWDEKVVDGLVNGVGYTLEGLSAVLRLFQTGFVGTYALFFTLGVLVLFFYFVRLVR
jgi:NADH-quinone oxidoreductase subunit L